MKRTAFIVGAAVLVGILVLSLSSDSPPTGQPLSVQFIGFTNDPVLGVSALLGITNTTGHGVYVSDLSLETRAVEDRHVSRTPAFWRPVGSPAPPAARNPTTIFLSLSQGRGFVAVVAKPDGRETCRVRVEYADESPMPARLLNRITRGWSKSYFPFKGNVVISPEIHD